MNKPNPKTISYYRFSEVVDYIKEVYELTDNALLEEWKKHMHFDGELLPLHAADYIECKEEENEELLLWYQHIRNEFGDVIILEWDIEEEDTSPIPFPKDRINSLPIEFLNPNMKIYDMLYERGLRTVAQVREFFQDDIDKYPPFKDSVKTEIRELFYEKLKIYL